MTFALVNLTPHPVSVIPNDVTVAIVAPSGRVARLREVVQAREELATEDGDIPLTSVRYSDHVDGLPEPRVGVIYLVSRVLAASVARADLVFPGGEVRDDNGNIIGCRYLGRFDVADADA